ncbi:MAG: hypothetical protein O7C75_14315 [Verrucomicrobia bacterium]|nr:hypothetical protein [Verrucomicrobiota bacterium]
MSSRQRWYDPHAKGEDEAFGYHRPWCYVGNPYDSGPWAKTMRTGRYRFTRWTTEIEGGEVVQLELYDHRIDPGEQHNIAQGSKKGRSLNIGIGPFASIYWVRYF